MSGRMHSKQPRAWDRGSPGRRRPGGERGKVDYFQRRESGSPDRSKRSRWESPSRHRVESPARTRRRDFESPPRGNQKEMISSPKSRRIGLEDGMRPSFNEQRRSKEEYGSRAIFQDSYREGQGPAGLVFLCNSSTLRECFHYRVLGLPAAQREVVERVVPGTKLFLFNFDTRELFGVFEATSRGGLNLVPEAFLDSKAAFGAQVRFNIIRECPPLADDTTRDVLRENFSQRGKFDCELSADQVLKIMQLFSHQDMHQGGPAQEMEKPALDSRNVPFGVNSVDPDGRRFPSAALQGSVLNAFPESQFLINKSHPQGANADPAVVLGQGMIEQADQLALKYLQNQPGFAGIRLEPVNTSLLSSTLRSNPQLGFSSPSLDLNPSSMPVGGSFGAVNLQPNGVAFPAVGGGAPNPRLLASSVPDALNRDRMELPGAEGGKIMGRFMPGALGSDRGLLPAPGMHQHLPLQPGMPLPNQSGFPLQPRVPNQSGMVLPFPPGAALPGAFPTAVGPVGGSRPEFGGPFVPFHHLQGPHGPSPSRLVNSSQMVNRTHNHPIPSLKVPNKAKRIKQKKRTKYKKGLAGGDVENKKDDTAAEEALDDPPTD